MIRELIAARLAAEFADAEGALHEIVQTGEQRSQARGEQARGGRRGESVGTRADRVPTSEAVQRALQGLQREAGLPVTGRFDDATVALLVQKGIVPSPSPPPTTTAAPATTAPPSTTTPANATTTPATPPAPERRPVDGALQAMKRASFTQQGRDLRARLEGQTPPPARGSSAPEPSASTPVDRALDPARLLASLVAAGFRGDTPTAALSSFQAAQGLPPSGQLDKHTVEAMAKAGVVSAEAASAHADKSAASAATAAATSSAKSDSSAGGASAAAGKAGNQGSGASTNAQAVRAPAASPEEARDRARLESLLAQVAATERGVQDQTGDLAALAGHGVNAGLSVGVSGSGGAQGGGADTGGDEASAAVDDGPAGEEDSVGNAHAGDDDHDDHERGEASDAAGADDVDNDVIPDGHYRTPSLHDQVQAALDTITRLDDDDGPVCYTWDVTLYRPGVYSDGQPAEAIWHLVVDRAHAFDPVWERAALAIAARLLYIEPDAEAPSLDDVLGALKRARVR